MSRYTDVDKLLKDEHQYYGYLSDEYYVRVRDIESAPTIEFTETDVESIQYDVDLRNRVKAIEDFEKELGIDLITMFKALKNGVYYFTNGMQLTKDYVCLVDNYMSVGTCDRLSYSFVTAHERKTLLFNDYGKMWALDKQELANDK